MMAQTMTISGYIRSNNGDYLPGANIIILDSEIGVMSDQNGFFVLNVPEMDLIILKVSYIGYKPAEIGITTTRPPVVPIQIFLERDALNFSPIEIIGARRLEKQVFLEPSFKVIRRGDINAISALDGNDVFRAIQNEPGVNSLNELSNQLYIRGGSPDQNLVLINGAPIYQPFHLFGLASSI
jgi:hypothetical protein